MNTLEQLIAASQIEEDHIHNNLSELKRFGFSGTVVITKTLFSEFPRLLDVEV